MTKELIQKLIDRARIAADNAYCLNTEVAVGACVLLETNQTITGCNVETASLTVGAAQSAIIKALTEGLSGFVAVAFWSEKSMPFPTGNELDFLSDFNPSIDVIVANKMTFSMHKLHELLPFRRIYD